MLPNPDRRNVMQMSLLAAALTALPHGAAQADATPVLQADASQSGDPALRDFDGHVGSWHTQHRQLKARLAGSTEWIEFDGTCVLWRLMEGAANVDDNVVNKPSGPYRAVTLRAYDPVSKTWGIWWLDGRLTAGPLDPPMRGSFKDGVGLFYADDTFNGKPIKVRFIWTMPTPTTPRWEQAFSADGGKTWETNWTTDFTRMA